MRRPIRSRLGLVFVVLLAACATGEFSSDEAQVAAGGGPVLPEARDSAGILLLEHDATDWARVPEWRLDSVPQVVFDGGDDPDFDLTYIPGIQYPVLLPDGRMVAAALLRSTGIMVFGSDGRPERMLARTGEGPGDVGGGFSIGLFLLGDTVVVTDHRNRRISRFTVADGLVGSHRWQVDLYSRCQTPTALLQSGPRFVTICSPAVRDSSAVREQRVLAISGLDLVSSEPVAEIPGNERRMVMIPEVGKEYLRWSGVEYGLWSWVVAWENRIVTATQAHGFGLELRDTTGTVRESIVVHAPRLPVTQAMRDASIDRDLARVDRESAHGGVPAADLRQRAREKPFADSLPWHGEVFVGADSLLWVMSPMTWADTAWTATAFRRDGALVGRIIGRGGREERPVWFGRDRVMVRQVDADGVVRFGVYQLRQTIGT